MAAIANASIYDGIYPTPTLRSFQEKGSSGGVATFMYHKTAAMSGWVKLVLTRVKNPARSNVRTFRQYVYLPTLATVDGKDVLIRYSDAVTTFNIHKDAIEQEIRDILAYVSNALVKPESMPGMLGAALISDSFPS